MLFKWISCNFYLYVRLSMIILWNAVSIKYYIFTPNTKCIKNGSNFFFQKLWTDVSIIFCWFYYAKYIVISIYFLCVLLLFLFIIIIIFIYWWFKRLVVYSIYENTWSTFDYCGLDFWYKAYFLSNWFMYIFISF